MHQTRIERAIVRYHRLSGTLDRVPVLDKYAFDETKHPRGGNSKNAGQFSGTTGHGNPSEAVADAHKRITSQPNMKNATPDQMNQAGQNMHFNHSGLRTAFKSYRDSGRAIQQHHEAMASGEAGEAGVPVGGATKPVNPQGKDSMEQHTLPNGEFSPERKALHDKIIAHFLQGAVPQKNPEAHMMGGGPASGKSVLINAGHVKLPENHVAIDPDEIKKHLPEYAQMVAAKDMNAAIFAHEESSHLGKRLMSEAAARKHHVVLDGTGDSGIESVSKKLAVLKQNGLKVHAHYVTVDTNTAVQRAQKRAEETGRAVPESFIRACHKKVSQIVPEAIKAGLFDHINVYDTNGGNAVKVATGVGNQLTVHNPQLWGRFMNKASE